MNLYLLFSGKHKWPTTHLQWSIVISENHTSLCRSEIQGRICAYCIRFDCAETYRGLRVSYKTERKTYEVNDQPTYFPIYFCFSRLNRRCRQRCADTLMHRHRYRLVKPNHAPIRTLRHWNEYEITKLNKYVQNTILYIALNLKKIITNNAPKQNVQFVTPIWYVKLFGPNFRERQNASALLEDHCGLQR